MKKLSIVCLAVVMAVVFGFTTVNAEPSAKASAQIGDLSIVDVSSNDNSDLSGNTGWTPLFTQNIKTPTGKDLFINVSLECGLLTNTKVMSRALAKAIATAEAIVEVRVVLDGEPVPVNGNVDMDGNPDPDTDITFARRYQELIAEFAGYETQCPVLDENGNPINDPVTGEPVMEDCILAETLELLLETMQANSYNFIVPDLEADTHTVQIEAKLSYLVSDDTLQAVINGEADAGSAAFSRAYLGNGSVTFEVVRMIKDEDVVVDLQL